MPVTRAPGGAQGHGEGTPITRLRSQAAPAAQAADSHGTVTRPTAVDQEPALLDQPAANGGASRPDSVAGRVRPEDSRGEAIERLGDEVVRLRGERAALAGSPPCDPADLPSTLVGLIAERTALSDQIEALRAPGYGRAPRPGRLIPGRRRPPSARRGLSILDEDLDDDLDGRPGPGPAIWVALLVVSLLLVVAGTAMILRR